MAVSSTHRGEMSQDSLMPEVHRTNVTGRATSPRSAGARSNPNGLRRAIDPAAREGKRVYNALNASSVGLEMGISVGIGIAAGYYMDKWLHTTPWMLLLWMVIGLAAGFRGVFRAIARADKAAELEKRDDGEAGRG
jgi:ATP synthase protein I